MRPSRFADDISNKNFTQIDVKVDPDRGIVWVYQNPAPRPCFNPALIREVRSIQLLLETYEGSLFRVFLPQAPRA